MFSDHFLNNIKNFPDKFSQDGFYICESVFDVKTFQALDKSFESKRKCFRPSQIGKGENKKFEDKIRSDSMLWLEKDDSEFLSAWTLLDKIFDLSKQELFLPLKRIEAQLALYPKGSFYKRHVDRHKGSPARLLSLVFYFNDWSQEDKGELVIYGDRKNHTDSVAKTISPIKNQMVIFNSELEHEVLPTNVERKSLTAWFWNDL